MKRKPGPSERYTCIRCGVGKVRNGGRTRRAQSTGLCLDCYELEKWQCPICLKAFALNYRSLHKRVCS